MKVRDENIALRNEITDVKQSTSEQMRKLQVHILLYTCTSTNSVIKMQYMCLCEHYQQPFTFIVCSIG